MSLLLKFSGLLLIVSTIGVLHSAASQYLMQPDVEKNTMYNEQRLQGQTSQANTNSSATESSSPAVFVDSINDVEQGSLFYLREPSEGSNPSDEHNERQNEQVRRYQLSPLLSTDVKINVTGMLARTQVTQRFHNPSQDWVNAIYAFPLPENAAVDHLNMTIGERKITGEIMHKQ